MKSVLIVEDNDLDFEQARERLEETGEAVKISRAITLREAEAIVKRQQFDLIVLDPGLPDVTDKKYEAYGRLCKYVVNPEQIKVVTGDADQKLVNAIKQRGSEVLSKDEALRGDALVASTFGVEFVLEQLARNKSSIIKYIEVVITRELVKVESSLEMKIGILRLEVEGLKRSQEQMINRANDVIQRCGEVTLKQDALTGTVNQQAADIKALKTANEAGASKLELAKLRWQTIAGLVTALITAGVTIAGFIYAQGKPDTPAVSPPAVSNTSPTP